MGAWVSRAWREVWVVFFALITALFGANDALDVLTWQAFDRWGFLLAFGLFFAFVFWRLLRLQERLDNRERVRTILESLGPFVTQGNRLMEQHCRPIGLRDGGPELIGQWIADAGGLFMDQYPEASPFFENEPEVVMRKQGDPSVACRQLSGRLLRLNDIMKELRDEIRKA